MIRLIRKQRLDRVYRSAFECSKVLGCTCLLGILKHRKYTAYAINPCIHAGFTHSRLIESLPLRQSFNRKHLGVGCACYTADPSRPKLRFGVPMVSDSIL